MNLEPGLPFVLGAASLVLSDSVQKLLSHNLRKDHRAAVNDGSSNVYNLPPKLDEDPAVKRFDRDADALGAVTYAATTLSSALVLFDTQSIIFAITLGIGVLLPASILATLLRIEPDVYESRGWFKRLYPVSPFLAIAVVISVGAAVVAVIAN